MNFRGAGHEEPEINLIPFIDVLLVVLIFLMLSTTYNKHTELQLALPTADAAVSKDYPREMLVTISAEGAYSINRTPLDARNVGELAVAMAQASKGARDTVVIISADASARHQSVISVLEAARRAELHQLTFATQSTSTGATGH